MKICGAMLGLSSAVAAISLCGCSGYGPRSIYNPDPDAKIPAIKVAVKDHNHAAVPQLIKDLDSDDPAVRFYAIRGLRDLTGETFGYNFYDDHDQRQPAVLRWKLWLSRQK